MSRKDTCDVHEIVPHTNLRRGEIHPDVRWQGYCRRDNRGEQTFESSHICVRGSSSTGLQYHAIHDNCKLKLERIQTRLLRH